MNDIQKLKLESPIQSKEQASQVVQPLIHTPTMSLLEVKMNATIIAALSIFGLGLLAFLAHKVSRVTVRKPILVEQRQIVYRRRP